MVCNSGGSKSRNAVDKLVLDVLRCQEQVSRTAANKAAEGHPIEEEVLCLFTELDATSQRLRQIVGNGSG